MKTTEIVINTTGRLVRKKKRKIRKIWKVMASVVIIASAISVINNNLERFSVHDRKALLYALEAGQPDAVEKFNDYIARDIYLFDGPMTMKAMADKYDMDIDVLKTGFEKSGYKNLQQYFDNIIKPLI